MVRLSQLLVALPIGMVLFLRQSTLFEFLIDATIC